MLHPVILTVVYHPGDPASKETFAAIRKHLDRLGMERAGIHMRIPVRQRSQPFDRSGALRPLMFGAKLDAVVVLHSGPMGRAPEPWIELLRPLARAPLVLMVPMSDGLRPLVDLPKIQTVRWTDWSEFDIEARGRRLLIHIVHAMRRRLAKRGKERQSEPIFISHAKRDGRDAAERVVKHINDPKNGLGLEGFYDALHLQSGEDWTVGLCKAAQAGSLLALVSDNYDDRPWCNQELLWAKQARRPILMVDIGRRRVGRCFPYAGNAPVLANRLRKKEEIEEALLELLSEALRCDLFVRVVKDLAKDPVVALPRPPELCDLAFCKADPAGAQIVYPDPPLSDFETKLLETMSGGRKLTALGDLAARGNLA